MYIYIYIYKHKERDRKISFWFNVFVAYFVARCSELCRRCFLLLAHVDICIYTYLRICRYILGTCVFRLLFTVRLDLKLMDMFGRIMLFVVVIVVGTLHPGHSHICYRRRPYIDYRELGAYLDDHGSEWFALNSISIYIYTYIHTLTHACIYIYIFFRTMFTEVFLLNLFLYYFRATLDFILMRMFIWHSDLCCELAAVFYCPARISFIFWN